MSTSGTNFTAGVTYLVTLAIPAGSHTYWFGAASGSGVGEQFATFTAVQPGAVVITNPTQAPTPVPPPPPPPVPQPVPVPPPVVQPPPPPPPTAPPATASPSASASSSPSSSPTTTPTEGAPSPTGPDPTVDVLPAAKVVGERPAAKPSASSLFGGSELPLLGTVWAYLWATAAGLTLFVFLVRRRKASEPGTPGMLSVAMAPSAVPAASSESDHRVTPLPPMRELIPPVNPYLLDVEERPGPVAGEADLPRWLRPSVRSGRRTRNPNRLSGRDD